jgi:hypothetical protein
MKRMKINAPKVVDTKLSLPDASSFTWRTKMAASSVYRPTDHVITNVQDPRVTPTSQHQSMVYKGTGFGGKVPDASTYTLGLSARALGQDSFNRPKIINGGGTGNTCLASPPASQVINERGNIDRSTTGLNMGYIASCNDTFTPGTTLRTAEFQPLSESHFVDRDPDLKTHKIGVSNAVGPTRGSQLPFNCTTTSTVGNWEAKAEVAHNLHSPPPRRVDFMTAPMGTQVSANGRFGRAPKVGNALHRPRYSESHHGLASQPNPPPAAFKPPFYPVPARRM